MILRLILGDQLNPLHSWFREVREDVVYALFESGEELRYAPHHRQKMLAFLHGIQQFAHHLRQSGHRVEYWTLDDPRQQGSLRANLETLKHELSSGTDLLVEYQEPDEYRVDQALQGIGTCVSSEHFLTQRGTLATHFAGKKTYLMESFYRAMRVRHGVLLDASGQPEGGTWNFDSDNRASWNPKQHVPAEWRAHHDVRELDARLDRHEIPRWGDALADDFPWPSDRSESLALLDHFIQFGLPLFGCYQDALAEGQDFLFHSRISFALNTKMLHPREVIEAAERAWRHDPETYPLPAVEGFIRQILGWREYVRGIYWTQMPSYVGLNALDAQEELPAWFWTGGTDMACLRDAITQTLEHGYAHHIQRLMVTGLYALLLGVRPQRVHEWYLAVYMDAVEWVELPNTLGMSQYADGGLMATKPYLSGSNYLRKMSDYKAEPWCDIWDALFWRFLAKHRTTFAANPRMALLLGNLDRMPVERRAAMLATAEHYLDKLFAGAKG